MIRLIKLLVVTTILSYLAVWLSNETRESRNNLARISYSNKRYRYFFLICNINFDSFVYLFLFFKSKNIPKKIFLMLEKKKKLF